MIDPYAIIASLFIGLLTSIFTIFFYEYLKYCKHFARLYCEIHDNWDKIKRENIQNEIEQMNNTFENNLQRPIQERKWIGFGKLIDIWVIHDNSNEYKDDYQYLSTNEIKNFINNGYFVKLDKILDSILEFYYYCESFSHSSQNLERAIFMNHNLRLSRRHEPEINHSLDEHRTDLSDNIAKIWEEYEYHGEKIAHHYNIFSQKLETYKPLFSGYYINKYCKRATMSRWLPYLFNSFFVIVGIVVGLSIIYNNSINDNIADICRNLSNICIIVCSISLTVIVVCYDDNQDDPKRASI